MKFTKNSRAIRPFLKFIVIILLVMGVLAGVYYYISRNDNCVNPYEVKDSSSGKEVVRICNNTFYRGAVKIVTDKEFPELFRFYLNKESRPDKVVQYVRVFEKEKEEYVSIKSVIDYSSWVNSSIGIYRKDGNEYRQVFKKTFSDNWGRWVNIEFGEDYTSRDPYFYLSSRGEGFSVSGDLGYLGCLGACRMLWWDYYDFDSAKKTFVLSNNKHKESFKRLLENYKEMDKTTCLNEADINKSISDLYPIRKSKEKICSDDAQVPYTSSQQAEMLLKGIKAIEKIIDGENISNPQVSEVKID